MAGSHRYTCLCFQLRKAYFRQVDEIRSLKERLSLKDKRIWQLEEELRLLAAADDDSG